MSRIHWVSRVGKVVRLVAGLVVTPEVRNLVRHERKPNDLSTREREECGCREDGGVYVVCM